LSRVLVVDDSSTVRKYYRELLVEKGHEVDEAFNGYEALEKIIFNEYDVLLADINMPKMDGYTFLRKIRTELEIKQVPVVLVSTEGGEVDIEQGYKAGCNAYLVKPVEPETILDLVFLLG